MKQSFRAYLTTHNSGLIDKIYRMGWDDLLLQYGIKKPVPVSTIKKLWSAEEKQFLSENYMQCSNKELAKHLGRSAQSVAVFLSKCGFNRGLTRYGDTVPLGGWLPEQEQFIRDNFFNMSCQELMVGLNKLGPKHVRTRVRMKYAEMGLRKQPAAEPVWTDEMVECLIHLRKTCSDYTEITKKLNEKFPEHPVTHSQTNRKFARIVLKDKKKNSGLTNIEYPRVNVAMRFCTKEKCLEEITRLGVKTRTELSDKSSELYNHMRKNKWLDSIPSLRPAADYTFEQCQEEALKYTGRTMWAHAHNGTYKRARTMGWIDSIFIKKAA